MSSTVRLRRLSQELVRLRNDAGFTVEEVSKRLDWAKGRLTYMERNKWVRADIGNVTRLLDLYEVDGTIRDAVLDLARKSREKGWWAAYRDVFPASYPGFEDAATAIRTFEALLVPGLLQTEEYAAAVLTAAQVLDPGLVDRKVQARLERQRVLHRAQPPELWAIIDEAALRKVVGGPEVMRAQLRHLIELAAWPHITIQVLPDGAGAHAAMTGSFVIMDFGNEDDSPLVYLEGATSSLYMEKSEDVQSYTLVFNRVLTSALTPEESMSYLAKLQDPYNK